MAQGSIYNLLGATALSLVSLTIAPRAQAYPVDCAILLCLAGGWPASAECNHARAVFIRRITPWPIEPPLQIWNCPMGIAAHEPLRGPIPRVWDANGDTSANLAELILAQVIDGHADIDISGTAFDFVRSIRVWDVRYYEHRERGENGDCSERFFMRLGTYGTQGDFAWQNTQPGSAPTWVLPSRRCGTWRRGVGVEWEDHEGNHGHEWVSY